MLLLITYLPESHDVPYFNRKPCEFCGLPTFISDSNQNYLQRKAGVTLHYGLQSYWFFIFSSRCLVKLKLFKSVCDTTFTRAMSLHQKTTVSRNWRITQIPLDMLMQPFLWAPPRRQRQAPGRPGRPGRTVSSMCSTRSCSQASSPSVITTSRVWFWVKPSMVFAILAINSTSHLRTCGKEKTDSTEDRRKFSKFRKKRTESHLPERKKSNTLAASYGAT